MHLATCTYTCTCTCTCTYNISFNSSHCTTAHVRTEYIHVDMDDYLKSFKLVSVKFDENLSSSCQNFLLLIARL